MNDTRASVIGLGYVGLPLALLVAKKGISVTGIDLDSPKVKLINDGVDPIGDEYIKKNLKGTTLTAADNFNSVKDSEVVLVCVPTPIKNGYEPDLTPLKGAVSSVAAAMSKGTLVVIESTINPGVCDEIVIPLIEEVSGLTINVDFQVSHCPERINPGDKKWSVENIPRVTGSSSEHGLKKTIAFYEAVIDAPIKPMATIKEAESVKIVENSFRDVNLAFVNELALSFTKLGIDVKNVIDGAATKPFAFMAHYPSVGVGGHCIPVDPYYLIEYARGYGFEHEFLAQARTINNQMPEYTVERLMDGLNEVGLALKGSRIAVLGLSYKANVADDRESPSYKLISLLEEKGAIVEVFDPHFPDKSSAPTLDKILSDKVGVILATNHAEFERHDYSKSDIKVMVDGKNVLNKADLASAKIVYRGIGR